MSHRASTTPQALAMEQLIGRTDLLNERGHLLADNWYSSVAIAESLQQSNTHFIGTCRKSRRGLPEEVVEGKLRKSEWKAM
ncbi:hypothetical protein KIN20_017361 [Parelaphostrongylus tenuis]|uniref:PiggyBac transposable element-derived protein domain-containing protein n=1 Tax=Parelaphostrongylus tenuis TaxID=148309 RepID=A0AAD5MHV6_PARTN|nr:hypothetical protein KIN20_017361 [Parelaphostrongylus tenuis]